MLAVELVDVIVHAKQVEGDSLDGRPRKDEPDLLGRCGSPPTEPFDHVRCEEEEQLGSQVMEAVLIHLTEQLNWEERMSQVLCAQVRAESSDPAQSAHVLAVEDSQSGVVVQGDGSAAGEEDNVGRSIAHAIGWERGGLLETSGGSQVTHHQGLCLQPGKLSSRHVTSVQDVIDEGEGVGSSRQDCSLEKQVKFVPSQHRTRAFGDQVAKCHGFVGQDQFHPISGHLVGILGEETLAFLDQSSDKWIVGAVDALVNVEAAHIWAVDMTKCKGVT